MATPAIPLTEPSADEWLPAAVIVVFCPAVTPRLLETWVEQERLPYSRVTPTKNSRKLFRLCDVRALLDAHVTPAAVGPLAAAGAR